MAPNTSDAGRVASDSDIPEVEEGFGEQSRMSFLDHLDELRRRLLYSIYAIVACCCVTFFYWRQMFEYLIAYFHRYGGTLIYNAPAAGFMFSLKIALVAALILASPFIFAQVWFFVAPGLYSKEKQLAVPFVVSSTLLFAAGAAFGHFLAYPSMWRFFSSYQMAGLQFFPTIDETFSFYMWMILGLGAVFQMPILVFILARFGIVTASFLIRKTKYAILAIFIIAAVVTPSPDVVNQLMFAAPMFVLYAISIGVAWMFGKKRNTVAAD